MWGAMGRPALNLIKLCVGAESVEGLAEWQAERVAETGRAPAHVTRMWPKAGADLLAGGSLYWVVKGFVLCRQRLVGLEPRDGADGVRRCALVLDAEIVRTAPQPHRPFQGWRYLRAADAPRDQAVASADARALPAALLAGLDAVGVL
jgi:hypothetical protein